MRRLSLLLAFVAACRSARPVAITPPPPLDDSSAAALRWIDAHAATLAVDTVGGRIDRDAFLALVGDARVVGLSELTEGTREWASIVREIVRVLADSGFRGLAIQAPMPEAMALDRYVRAGVGDPRRLLRALGSPHWETRDMLNLLDWFRDYNRNHASSAQLGFYGFEIPNATYAVHVVTSLPDSIAGAELNRWIRQQYGCVTMGERANWGREGYAADSTFWKSCETVATSTADSLSALRQRLGPRRAAADVAFAEEMARMVAHYVGVGLRRVARHEAVASHVEWLVNYLGANAKLLVWGRDVEAGRLELRGGGGVAPVVQMAVPLSKLLGGRYRAVGFAVGDGSIRARIIAAGRGEAGGESNIPVGPPLPGSYENVLNRARLDSYFVDARSIGKDTTAAWLAGPHSVRLISGTYAPQAAQLFLTPIQLPANFDALVFVKRVTPAVRF